MKYYSLGLFCLISVTTSAQNRSLPQIPARTVSVLELGADRSGMKVSTTALQGALDQVGNNGGGRVVVPKGTYLCGPLKLRSHTELILESGAILRLINGMDNFPSEKSSYLNFIDGSRVTDIKISGSGIIDGQGKAWWERYDQKKLTLRRPQLLYLDHPVRVEVTGVTFLNPPNTHISIKGGTDVYIHRIRIEAPGDSHNTDGINISARFCTIDSCDISTGDDNIAFNFSRGRDSLAVECEQILISNCTFGRGHGLSIGSYTSGNLKNLIVKECTFDGTTSALRIKSARGRGGRVENLLYENIMIKNASYPIYISSYYPKEPQIPESDTTRVSSVLTPDYRNITFRKITIINAQIAIRIWGVPEKPLNDIHFEDMDISSQKGAVVNNVRNLTFKNTRLKINAGEKVKSYNAQISGL